MKSELEGVSWLLETLFPNSIICKLFLTIFYVGKEFIWNFVTYFNYIYPFLHYILYFFLLLISVKTVKFIVSIFNSVRNDFEFVFTCFSFIGNMLWPLIKNLVKCTAELKKTAFSTSACILMKANKAIQVSVMVLNLMNQAKQESICFELSF